MSSRSRSCVADSGRAVQIGQALHEPIVDGPDALRVRAQCDHCRADHGIFIGCLVAQAAKHIVGDLATDTLGARQCQLDEAVAQP